ncbi:efflux RND transporter periplasmic adaptor subunit [Sporomusa malonica]|uniref:RND family efflux transporter, MFP subunit n=1 Tax=Sporomusa malonica TaxID=112901 RepID=A0A1W1Y8X1_9FIRM|nr:efflux RND transporter periplasmic adaptor subunit [Sporomusa malonica]SMC32612.1 RND family efflux transporter, MFP subunit [Sporomusa malonica]
MQPLNWLPKTPKQKLYYGLTATVIALCIAGGVVWNGHRQTKVVTEDITAVQTAVISTAAAAKEYTYSGEVRGRYESQLAFQVSGKVIKRYVELGSTVRAGDVLMEIDSKDLQQLVNSNSAQVYSAEANLRLAETNLKRFQQLYNQGAVSRAVLDQYQTAYDVGVAATRQSSAQMSHGVNQLNYSSLYADHSGVIANINVEAGQVVGAGQPALVLVRDGEREVEISVPENRIEELRKSSQIKVAFWALPNVTTEGKVREIAPMADPLTRTYKVRISVLNPSPDIKLGMTASVSLMGSETQVAATIPLAAIYQNGGTPSVWVVTGDTVTLRPVKTGNFGNGTIQVVAGLQQGDRIVTAGVHKLSAGQKVKLGGDSL